MQTKWKCEDWGEFMQSAVRAKESVSSRFKQTHPGIFLQSAATSAAFQYLLSAVIDKAA